jgi:hypothetical protein
MAADPRLRTNGQLRSYDDNPLAVFRDTAFAEHKIADKSLMRIGLCDTLHTLPQNVLHLIGVLL